MEDELKKLQAQLALAKDALELYTLDVPITLKVVDGNTFQIEVPDVFKAKAKAVLKELE